MKLVRALLLGFAFAAALAAAPAASQDSPAASRPSDPRARWNSLTEAERDRYRKMFEEFQKLPPEKREIVKQRVQGLSAERNRLEESLSPEERASLDSLDREARERWLHKAAAEMLRSRHDRVTTLVPHEKADTTGHRDPKERGDAVRKLSEDAVREAIRRTTDSAARKKLITAEQAEAIRAMPIKDAIKESAALRKQMIVADWERNPGKRAELSDEEWETMKALEPRQFLQRVELLRALPRTMGPGMTGPGVNGPGASGPEGKRPQGPLWKAFHGHGRDREGREKGAKESPQTRRGI